MVITWTAAAWFLPFVLPIAFWVCWSDLARMKIPNLAVGAMLLVFAIVGLVALPFTEYLWRYAHFAVVLAIGFGLNMIRAVGAGDAKFAAAMAPYIALPDWYSFMFLLGGTMIVSFLVHRAVRASALRHKVSDWESWTRREFPMGFALAPALVFYLLIGLTNS